MNWICAVCEKTVSTNSASAKPLPAGCKDKNGKSSHHKWKQK